MGRVYGWGGGLRSGWAMRVCVYPRGVQAALREGARGKSVRITASEGDSAREIAYVAALSLVGEALDLRGFHRIHALGISGAVHTGAWVLPSGGGKSSIAALLSGVDGIRLFSDEQPLVRAGMLYPFPIRIALAPSVAKSVCPDRPGREFPRLRFPEKRLFDVANEHVSDPRELTFIGMGRRTLGSSSLLGRSGWSAAARFIATFTLGLGIQQMAEYMLTLRAVPRLLRIAQARLRAAIHLVFRQGVREFLVSADAFENARLVREALRE